MSTIESLELQIQSSSQSAESGLDALSNSLGKLKSATKGGVGLTTVIHQLDKLDNSLNKLSSLNITHLKDMIGGLNGLKSLEGVKISSTIAKSISDIGDATNNLSIDGVILLGELAPALSSLSSLGDIKISSTIGTGISSITGAVKSINLSELSKIAELANAVSSLAAIRDIKISSTIAKQVIDLGIAAEQLQGIDLSIFGNLAEALAPLSTIQRANLTSTITQLNKIPDLVTALNATDLDAFRDRIVQLASALQPLATQMNAISSGFAAFPQRIQRLITSTDGLSTANARATTSYINLYAKLRMAITSVRSIARLISSWIHESNQYIEDLNLFNASLGEYAREAQNYAERVSEIMGTDPSTWMRNQGVFMTLATGFGVASDRAYVMSQQLTQLGYDLSSFFNIRVDDAMQKLQSGISGELEPLRRLGYDLSQARLKAIALELGITKAFNAMTQAEKSQLRYYAIMTQVTVAQGDMGRTLDAPANQLRILQAQVTQAARALGNIFIPILNAALPVVIALAKAVRILAASIASLFGFSLPEVDYSGIVSDVSAGVGDLGDNLDSAGGSAQKLKKYLMGFDELNILGSADTSGGAGGGGGGGGGGGDWDWDLPAYDFLGDAISTRVDEWMKKFQPALDWIKEHLDGIFDVVISIAAGFAAWKISTSIMSGVSGIKDWFSKNKVAIGITLMVTGITMAATSGWDIGYSGPTWANVIRNAIGNALIIGGALLTFGTGSVGWAVGLGLAITVTLTSIILGANKKRLEAELRSQFGDITLTVEQITALVQKTIDKDFSNKIKLYLEVDSQLLDNLKKINNTKKTLEFFKWKISMGLTLSESEIDEYKTTIDSYVGDCLEYVKQRGYKIDIGLKTAFPDSVDEDGNTLLLGNAAVTKQLNAELTQIGNDLADVLATAFTEKGELKLDAQREINRLLGQMTEIMEVISNSKLEAELAMIDLKFGGAELTQESYDAYYQALYDAMDTLKADADRETENMLIELTANVAYAELALSKDPDNVELQRVLALAQSDLDLFTAANPLQARYKEIELEIERQAIAGLVSVFGEKITEAFTAENATDGSFLSQWLFTLMTPEAAASMPVEQAGDIIKEKLYESITYGMDGTAKEYVDALCEEFDDAPWELLSTSAQQSVFAAIADVFGSEKATEIFEDLGFDLSSVMTVTQEVDIEKGNWEGQTWQEYLEFTTDPVRQRIDLEKGRWLELPTDKTVDYIVNLKQGSGYGKASKNYSSPFYGVSMRAGGGFPAKGELFVAKEAGPELIGRIGNKSAVANDEQIGEAIFRYMDAHGGSNEGIDEEALARAMVRAMVAQGVGAVYVDGKQLNQSTNRATKRAGRLALNL